MARPFSSRKRDLVYLIFFSIHLPVIFAVDAVALYPPQLVPGWMAALRNFYITTYQDRFFIAPPAWFKLYIWLEVLYHAPLSAWAVGALWRDDPKVPVHLLGYAVQTAVTTATCIAEYLSWEDFSAEQKLQLGYLYVPYLAVAVFMGVDMFGRLLGQVERARGGVKKVQ